MKRFFALFPSVNWFSNVHFVLLWHRKAATSFVRLAEHPYVLHLQMSVGIWLPLINQCLADNIEPYWTPFYLNSWWRNSFMLHRISGDKTQRAQVGPLLSSLYSSKCGLHLPQGLKGDRSPPGVDVNEDGRSFAGLRSEAVIGFEWWDKTSPSKRDSLRHLSSLRVSVMETKQMKHRCHSHHFLSHQRLQTCSISDASQTEIKWMD